MMSPDDFEIPDLRCVEPLPTRNPPPLPYPGPESRDTYTPTRPTSVVALNGENERPNLAIDAWLFRADQAFARMERDPAYRAYVQSLVF